MDEILSYELPEVEGEIKRVSFGSRIVEYWGEPRPTEKVLIAHDGQCIFDPKSAKRNTTWRLAETSTALAREFDTSTPLIIAIWHQGEVGNSILRGLDLSPEDYFKSGMPLFPKNGPFDVNAVQGNSYLESIFEEIVPSIVQATDTDWSSERTAMIGASRGALSTLYALHKHTEKFTFAIAHSTHWPIGRNPLVEMTINNLPDPGKHRIWMSHGSAGFDEEYGPYQHYAHELLKRNGFRENVDFSFHFYPGDAHDEASWARQAPDSLRNWFQNIL